MFCSECGKELRANAAFCAYCGHPVNNDKDATPNNLNTQTQQPVQMSSNGIPIINASADMVYRYGHSSAASQATPSQSAGEVYYMTRTMTQAANLAVLRATEWRRAYEGEEDYETSQFYPDCNIKKLLKIAEKEDASNAKRNTKVSYIVSPEGAIGEIVDEDYGTTPECDIFWQLYTKEKVLKYLPKWQRDISIQQS